LHSCGVTLVDPAHPESPPSASWTEAESILDRLEFDPLPAPPSDPYAGWPLINDNPGDSLRPPPGWAAAAAMFPPDKTSRPRDALLRRQPAALRAAGPARASRRQAPSLALVAVANDFRSDGVLLWVTEEDKGGESLEFSEIDGDWPSRADFRPAELFTQPNPELRWLRAGGSFRGYRVSVMIGIVPGASPPDVELALKSAASLAISGCWRDVIDDCPDQ
jgi:hypothetical protein